jgi:disulfide oxidoreductase YuzD
MSVPEEYEQHKALLEGVDNGRFFYPLVFVNGELKLSGTAEYYEILYVLREVLEPVGN